MGKRGRKPAVPRDDILNELKNHDILDEHRKLKKESDPIWINVM